jgi:uncharacterized protein (TIGR00369 family)
VKTYALSAYFGTTHDELLDTIPHAASLGMKVVEVGPARAVLRMPYQEMLIGDPTRGVVFGGVITTLIDQALGLAVSCSLEDLRPIATLDLRIDYLRPAEPGCDLYGLGECYKNTRSVGFARGIAYDKSEDDPFATCLATFMLGSTMGDSPFVSALEEYGNKK